jgi:uncharacterized membrane protein
MATPLSTKDTATALALLASTIGLGVSAAAAVLNNHPFSIPIALSGVLFFGAMIAALFARKKPHVRWRRWLAFAGAATAIFLIVLQTAVFGVSCKTCLVADGSAIVLASSMALGPKSVDPGPGPIIIVVFFVGIAFGTVLLWTADASPRKRPAVGLVKFFNPSAR